MTARVLDISIEQGSQWVAVITCRDADNVPLDLTGYEARMQIRATADAVATMLSITSTGVSPAIVVTAATGVLTITIPATSTASLTAGSAVYDIEIYPSEAAARKVLRGNVDIVAEVTHA